MANRISQVPVEAVITPNASAHASQIVAEIIYAPSSMGRITQVAVEIISPYTRPVVSITSIQMYQNP